MNDSAGEQPRRESVIAMPNGMRHGAGMATAVKANGFIFCSALRGHPPGKPDDLGTTEEQARQAIANLRLIMEHFGGTLDDVVKVTLYLADLAYREDFHRVWVEIWPTDPPARIAVQVADANTRPGRNAHFVLDVVAVAP